MIFSRETSFWSETLEILVKQLKECFVFFFIFQTLSRYFSEVQELSKELGKQLWVIIQRMLISVRREPTLIVTALRIIEREER